MFACVMCVLRVCRESIILRKRQRKRMTERMIMKGEGGCSKAGRATNDRNGGRKTYAAVAVGRAGLGSPAVSLVQALAPHGHKCENCRLHKSHVTARQRTWGSNLYSTARSNPSPVTRHNQLWNIQLLAISLPLVSFLPKGKLVCCAVKKRPTGRSQSKGQRNENAYCRRTQWHPQ